MEAPPSGKVWSCRSYLENRRRYDANLEDTIVEHHRLTKKTHIIHSYMINRCLHRPNCTTIIVHKYITLTYYIICEYIKNLLLKFCMQVYLFCLNRITYYIVDKYLKRIILFHWCKRNDSYEMILSYTV